MCGVVLPGGQVLERRIDARRVHDRFRAGLLRALVQAERLSPSFAEVLVAWPHPRTGFSVFVGEPVPPTAPDDQAALKRVSRYLVRPTLAYRRVQNAPGGRIRILASTPGRPSAELDPVEAIHRQLLHVPAKGQHQVRYYGAYANRLRGRYREPEPDVAREVDEADASKVARAERVVDRDNPVAVARLIRWARLIARVFEVDPLICPRCGHEMQVVGFVTQPAVIDKILAHREAKQLTSPFEPRAPPAA
ncbi:MAG: hypothetical protein GY944_26555 [bacterium]|nr:hypothetical protein [bacterium]